MNEYPEFVSVLNNDGSIQKVPYQEIKEHEQYIIHDNVLYGYLHCEYTEQDITDYKKQAYDELKELKRKIKENNDIVLKMNEITERYEPV